MQNRIVSFNIEFNQYLQPTKSEVAACTSSPQINSEEPCWRIAGTLHAMIFSYVFLHLDHNAWLMIIRQANVWGRHVLRTWKETYVCFFYRFLLDPWKCVCVCVYFNFGWTKHKPLVPVWLQTVRNNKVQVPSGEKLNVLLLFLFVDTVLAVSLKLKLGPLEMATFTSMNCSKWRASPSMGFRTAAFL